jgi:hypothetical protein
VPILKEKYFLAFRGLSMFLRGVWPAVRRSRKDILEFGA